MRGLRSLAIPALIPVALAGCAAAPTSSAGNFHGVQATVAKVIDNLSSDASARDTSKICNQIFAADLARRLAATGSSCETAVGNQLNDVDTFTVKVERVNVNGTSAQAQVQSINNGKNQIDTLNLVQAADGSWRIESLG